MNAITNWFDKVLVPEWRSFWKMASFWWNTLCAAAVPVWLTLPVPDQHHRPDEVSGPEGIGHEHV